MKESQGQISQGAGSPEPLKKRITHKIITNKFSYNLQEKDAEQSDDEHQPPALVTSPQNIMLFKTLPLKMIRRAVSLNRSRHSNLVKRFRKIKNELASSIEKMDKVQVPETSRSHGGSETKDNVSKLFTQTPTDRHMYSAMDQYLLTPKDAKKDAEHQKQVAKEEESILLET